MVKIHILYHLQDGPYGGVNQFLKAIKGYFVELGVYEEDPAKADIFLFNSCNDINAVAETKRKYPDKIFVQRMDGPVRLYNGNNDKRDLIAYTMNDILADATVFQSIYSQKNNLRMGLKENTYERIITNAPNKQIFNRIGRKHFVKEEKIKIIASSWSDNWNKGFRTYQYLDNHLDFDRFEMLFIGNSPIQFKNIKQKAALGSQELSTQLKKSDIYITASQKESCSNSLIEAMFCGLPAIALKDGGNAEIVKTGGELFEREDEVIPLIEKIVDHYDFYQEQIDLPTIEQVGQQYYEFLEMISHEVKEKKYIPKKMNYWKEIKLKRAKLSLKIFDKIIRLQKRK